VSRGTWERTPGRVPGFAYGAFTLYGWPSQTIRLPSTFVTPLDTTPPLPPSSPFLIKAPKGCLVVWERSPSKDVTEYRIFVNGKQFSINGRGIYFYFPECPRGDVLVVAVDKAGNLSKPVKAKEVVNEESCSDNGK